MGLLKELFKSIGLPKTPITFEETKKYNCEDYTIESVKVKGKNMYKVLPVQNLEEKQITAKTKKENFRNNVTRGGELQGIDRNVAINSRIDRQKQQERTLNDWTNTKGYLKYKNKTSENTR